MEHLVTYFSISTLQSFQVSVGGLIFGSTIKPTRFDKPGDKPAAGFIEMINWHAIGGISTDRRAVNSCWWFWAKNYWKPRVNLFYAWKTSNKPSPLDSFGNTVRTYVLNYAADCVAPPRLSHGAGCNSFAGPSSKPGSPELMLQHQQYIPYMDAGWCLKVLRSRNIVPNM